YLFYYLFAVAAAGWLVATLVAALAAVLFGVALDRFVYAPIQRHEGSFFTLFVASFGVAIVVQNLIGMIFGRGFVTVSTSLSRSIEVTPGLYVSPLSGIAIACAIVFFIGLQFFFTRIQA